MINEQLFLVEKDIFPTWFGFKMEENPEQISTFVY